MDLDIRQILTQIVAFLIMLWVLKRYAWKPLLGILDERRERIEAEFNSLADQEAHLNFIREDYEGKLKEIDAEARQRIQDAVAEGRKISREIQEEAQENARAILSKAKVDIATEMDNAKKELKDELVGIVVAATEKILQQKLDRSTHDKLIADFVDQVEFK